jgi:YYY domain-containing protein
MTGQALAWWLVIQGMSLVTLPIAMVLFRNLPGRGYAFAKPLALLLGGYLYWLSLSLHILPNRPGSVAWVFIFLAAVSFVVLVNRKPEARQVMADSGLLSYVVAVEAVFALAFGAACFLRSFVPEVVGTEKPMDFMLLNAVARDRYYPPADPWLAGFDVSYYYFGYLIQAMVAKLAFVSTSVAFNLALAATAALTATAAFGLGYEVVRLWRRVTLRAGLAVGCLALVLVTVMGNLEGALEFAIANDGSLSPGVIDWVDINGLDSALPSDACIVGLGDACIEYPNDASSHWWWWRATRISPDGNSITEFPFFSFMLGDLHPHVMAIPFVLTLLAAALGLWRWPVRLTWLVWRDNPILLLLFAVLLGGLGFLNTWDLPTFAFVLTLLVVARNLVDRFDRESALRDTGGFAGPLIALAFLLYLPFYLGFSSQADGLEAVRSAGTRPLHSFLFWGPLFAVALPLPLYVLAADRAALESRRFMHVVAIPVGLLALWLVVLTTGGAGINDAVSARGAGWLTLGFLVWGFVVAVMALWRCLELAAQRDADRTTPHEAPSSPASDAAGDSDVGAIPIEPRVLAPILIMTATALLLILGAELFYIRDVFNSRLNTVFKLYYQAWLLLGVSGAAGLYVLAGVWRTSPRNAARFLRPVWAASVTLLVAAALLYPLGATLSRTEGLARSGRTLDGLAQARKETPDDWALGDWLVKRAGSRERILEGSGGQYSAAARIAAWSGVPSVLGWRGHEVQWGRSEAVLAEREKDVDFVYTAESLADALPILQKYRVSYVVVGEVERSKYPAAGLQKFASLDETFRFGQAALYRVPVEESEPAAAGP